MMLHEPAPLHDDPITNLTFTTLAASKLLDVPFHIFHPATHSPANPSAVLRLTIDPRTYDRLSSSPETPYHESTPQGI